MSTKVNQLNLTQLRLALTVIHTLRRKRLTRKALQQILGVSDRTVSRYLATINEVVPIESFREDVCEEKVYWIDKNITL